MTADSTGRRDGFERWVAAVKQDHQPMAAKPAALNKAAVPKLELELDENATHVHRIPKDLINRMREREAEPAPPETAPFESLAGVADDRTAVFRPPPELLARAKRMQPPAKPSANEAPTKPPPPLVGEELAAMTSMPAAPKVPFTSAPAAARPASAPAQAPAAPVARSLPTPPRVAPGHIVPVMPVAAAPSTTSSMPAPPAEREAQSAREIEAGWDDSEPSLSATAGMNVPERPSVPRSVFTPEEAGTPTTMFRRDEIDAPASLFDSDEASSGVIPVGGSATPLLAPPVWETTGDVPAESVPPTTTAPVVRSEQSEHPEPRSPLTRNLLVFALGLIVIAALAFWKSHH